MKITYKYTLIILGLLVFSCGPKKGIVTKRKNQKPKTEKVVKTEKKPTSKKAETTVKKPVKVYSEAELYINKYAAIAKAEMRKHKIPASITLAQGILESAYGKGRLAVKANNHFGIKCHGWTGGKIFHDDDYSQECFRKYNKVEQSYKDHSIFLLKKRYAKLFRLKQNDYKGWARGLRAAGYATDRKYPQKLISIIERYELYRYDEKVLGISTKRASYNSVINNLYYNTNRHIVIRGDTLYSLSKRYNTTIKALKDSNGLDSNLIIVGQILKISN